MSRSGRSAAFHDLGVRVHAHHRSILVVSALLVLAALVVVVEGGRLTTATIRGLEADAAQRQVDAVRGFPLETTFVAVFESPAGDGRLEVDDEAFTTAVAAALARAQEDPAVVSVKTADELPPSIGLLMSNGEAGAVMAYVTLRGELGEARHDYPRVRRLLDAPPLTVTCTGHLPYVHHLDETLASDLLHAELISLPLALIVLVLVFRTALAALLPVAVGLFSVLIAIASVLLVSRVYDMAQYTVNVCSLIGLGVSIDYALFIVSRYREELAAGFVGPEALGRTMASAGRIVVFSGVAVASGLVGLVTFTGSYLEAMGIGGVMVVVLAVIAALTVLPALLALLGPRIRATPPRKGGAWTKLVHAVMARPVVVLVPTLLVLLVMGSPFLRLEMAAADVRVLPPDVEARQGYERLRAAFPDIAATRIEIPVTFPSGPALTATRAAALVALDARLRAIPGVDRVESVATSAIALHGSGPDAALALVEPSEALRTALAETQSLLVRDRTVVFYAVTTLKPETEAARDIVRAIRGERAVADGTLRVGGAIAHDLDTTAFILGHTPLAAAIVVGATVVALFLLLGSVILPLKALAMNMLSIAGSFGALVWIFQDGHLFVTEPRPVEPTLPILLFCILFGLSMDYEVLMLGRIKEVYEESRDNAHAVAEGLERTGGLITSAAAIMVAVFGAFALGRVVLIQAVGFGMALAVALDATLVRVLLVPATMRLFGDLNWWLPKPLARLRAKLGFGEVREED